MGLGRKGERVAKTPMRVLPPSRGGKTVGDQRSRMAWEKTHRSQRWEYPSMPRRAVSLRYSGVNQAALTGDGEFGSKVVFNVGDDMKLR